MVSRAEVWKSLGGADGLGFMDSVNGCVPFFVKFGVSSVLFCFTCYCILFGVFELIVRF